MDFKITTHRIQILKWFLKRPQLYKQFFRETCALIQRNQHPTLDFSDEAEAWCKQNAISNNEALEKLGIINFYEIKEKYKTEYNYAYKVSDSMDFDWGGEGNGQLLYHLIKNTSSKKVLETGVAYGWSSLAILLAIQETSDSVLYSVDMPFFGTKDDTFVGCVIPFYLRNKWNLIRLADRDGIPIACKSEEFDIIHYDSDKSYNGRKWAYPKLWNSLKKNGYLISDDISDNLAFKEFSKDINEPPLVVEIYDNRKVKHVGILVKSK